MEGHLSWLTANICMRRIINGRMYLIAVERHCRTVIKVHSLDRPPIFHYDFDELLCYTAGSQDK